LIADPIVVRAAAQCPLRFFQLIDEGRCRDDLGQ
jgi:hypothetical protein